VIDTGAGIAVAEDGSGAVRDGPARAGSRTAVTSLDVDRLAACRAVGFDLIDASISSGSSSGPGPSVSVSILSRVGAGLKGSDVGPAAARACCLASFLAARLALASACCTGSFSFWTRGFLAAALRGQPRIERFSKDKPPPLVSFAFRLTPFDAAGVTFCSLAVLTGLGWGGGT
jgi:hypothetical protein